MKTLRYCISVLAVLTAVTGCNKFLDRFPTDRVSSNTVFTSGKLAESAVISAYSNILYDYVSADLDRINWDAFAGVIDPYYDNFYTNYLYLNGNVQPNAPIFLTYWKRLYEGINRANDIIGHFGEVPDLPDDVKACRIAECKFLRAYHYYKLNALWGGVPWYEKNLAPSEYTRPRSTEDEIWDKIIQDLTDCINCPSLPDKIAGSSSDYGRITKGAAYALRGKVYLWKKMYAEAEADFLAIAPLGYGLLQKPYADIFKLANETSEEIIFSARMVELSGWGNAFSRSYGSWQVAGKGGNNTFYMNQQFVDSYPCADGKEFKWDNFLPGWSSMTPAARSVFFLRDGLTQDEISQMEEYGADMSQYLPSGNEARIKAVYNARDPRLLASVITPYSTYSGGFYGAATNYTRRFPYRHDQAPQNDLRTKQNTHFYYCIRKFVTVGTECTNETYNPLDIPIIRYAGVLLDLAEAVAGQNRPDEALGYVNQVRDRAGVSPYLTSDGIKEKIVNERRWEFACEETLYYDELRCGTWKDFRFAAGNGLAEPWGTTEYRYSWGGDAYYHWPIPSKEREMNTNLVQNAGWLK